MIRVYVAGKLNADAPGYIQNLRNMSEEAGRIQKLGFAVFNPGADIITGLVHGDFNYQDYFGNNIEWLKVSQIMYIVPGWETSEGTKKEKELAYNLNIPIVYDIEELLEVAEDLK